MDEWKNGLPDEYEQEEEISEQGRRDLAAEQQEALELELEQDEQRERAVPQTRAGTRSPGPFGIRRPHRPGMGQRHCLVGQAGRQQGAQGTVSRDQQERRRSPDRLRG